MTRAQVLKLVGILGIVLLLHGCDDSYKPMSGLSLHPLVREEESTHEPELVGTWVPENEEDEFLRFEETEPGVYRVEFVKMDRDADGQEKEKVVETFEARTMWLGRFRFLEMYPKEPRPEAEYYIPGRLIFRLDLDGDVLKLRVLSADWLKARLEDRSVEIAHENVDGVIVLTASTDKLQEFFVRHGWDDEAFGDEDELVCRRKR